MLTSSKKDGIWSLFTPFKVFMCSFICSFIFAQFSFLYVGSDKLKLLTVSSLKEAKVTGSFFSEPESNDVMNLASDRGNHNSQDALEITVATGRGKGN